MKTAVFHLNLQMENINSPAQKKNNASQLSLARRPKSCAGPSGSAAAFRLPFSSPVPSVERPQPSPASYSSPSCQHSLSPIPFPLLRQEPCRAEEVRTTSRGKTRCWDSQCQISSLAQKYTITLMYLYIKYKILGGKTTSCI